MVKVLRPFHDAPSGRYVRPGDEVDPTPGRHDELAANGLVPPRQTEEKAAAPLFNKMAAPLENKEAAIPSPELIKRGPGRPPRAK